MAQALVAKLFQSKKFQSSSQNSRSQSKSNTKWHVKRFTKEHINLVVFKDCASGGKQPVLDSRCIRKVTIEDLLCEKCRKQRKCCKRMIQCRARCPNCPGSGATQAGPQKYKNVCSASKNDVKLVGEMIFGTAPLASSGTTIKVHSLKSPHQLMLSCVSQYKRCKDQIQADFDSLDSFESSMYGGRGVPRHNSENNLVNLAASISAQPTPPPLGMSRPVDMPSPETSCYGGSDTSLNLSVTSAGSSGLHNPIPSPGSNSLASINSGSNLNKMRRMRHSFNRSLQYNTANGGGGSVTGCESPQLSSYSSGGGECGGGGVLSRRRGPRIGMAVIFSLDEFDDSRREFETFFFSHVTLIEGQLVTLRSAIERCAGGGSKVTEYVMEALEVFRDKVYDLYTAQRLPNPVWLSMMASNSQRFRICERFVKDFTTLIDRYDTKSTNYFVSTLLTGVLMYHLAWVPTVTPSGEINSTYTDKHSAKWLDMLAKSHPYNPLWAQLSDMYGAIGLPPRLARTVVTGKKMDTIIKFLYVLSYFIRCSEIHETFDACYDEEHLLNELASAATDDICIESMEKDATRGESSPATTDFVLVDPPDISPFLQDTEVGSDSGLVSQYTGQSRPRPETWSGATDVRRRHAPTDSESGYTESNDIGSLADVRHVPASSPADKVRQWINTSSLHVNRSGATIISATSTDAFIHKSTTNPTLVNCLDGNLRLRNSSSPTSLIENSQKLRTFPSPPTSPIDSSLRVLNPSDHTSPTTSGPTSPTKLIQCLPSPMEGRLDNSKLLGRSAVSSHTEISDVPGSRTKLRENSDQVGPLLASNSLSRRKLVRLFSSEIDDFDEYFDGKPPSLSRQASSSSQFDDLFDDDNLDSFSAFISSSVNDPGGFSAPGGFSEPATPTNNRNMLNKVLKETGFHQNAQQHQTTVAETAESPVVRPMMDRVNSNSSNHMLSPPFAGSAAAIANMASNEDNSRPRNLSISKQSSRCSTPHTMCPGGTTTPCSGTRCGKQICMCVDMTPEQPDIDDLDPFGEFDELDMPRSTNVSKHADTSISTTSFGRQQFAGFSDHYLSDFVLHGTSDDNVITKAHKDLRASVEHSVLEDRISEAVCIVGDTERWTVNVCSSMREQPKHLAASHLVQSMVEAVSNLSKLHMSPEFILMHMEDRLQEMFFKSRMLSEYISSRKKVDMDELDAMFGMDVTDIRFLLSVAATHSTVNVDGIY